MSIEKKNNNILRKERLFSYIYTCQHLNLRLTHTVHKTLSPVKFRSIIFLPVKQFKKLSFKQIFVNYAVDPNTYLKVSILNFFFLKVQSY